MEERLYYTINKLEELSGEITDLTKYLSDTLKSTQLWDEDIEHEIYKNPNPTNPKAWAIRRLDEIIGVCIHHTISQSPHWVFENYCKSKGRPTGPYTLWVTADGRVLKCVDLTLANWHNHEGSFRNLWLSVGLAGDFRKYAPPLAQMKRVAKLISNIIRGDEFPIISDISQIKGHEDFYPTQCPAWDKRYVHGGWKDEFYDLIRSMI